MNKLRLLWFAPIASFVVLVLAASVTGQSPYSNTNSNSRFVFSGLADVSILLNSSDGSLVELEAFKAASNDRILDNRVAEKYAQLSWYSIGLPTLVATATATAAVGAAADNSRKLIHFRKRGFYTFVQMLVPAQRHALAQSLSQKYKVSIDASQVLMLPLNKFECVVSVYDNKSRQRVAIRGAARNFQSVDLRVDFYAPVGSNERKLIEAELASGDSIDVYCTASANRNGRAGSKLGFDFDFDNQLVLSPRKVESLRLVDALFYPRSFDFDTAESVYVTRPQLAKLATDLYTKLNIRDDFDMSESQFTEAFVDDFVDQVGVDGLSLKPFDSTIGKLSRYAALTPTSTPTGERTSLNRVQLDMFPEVWGRVFYVDRVENVSVISFVHLQSYASTLESAPAVFWLSSSIGVVLKSQRSWIDGRKSLDEQLRDLNADSERVIEWVFDRNRYRLLPKSMRVVEVSRASLSSSRPTPISFSRVRRPSTSFDSSFEKSFVFYVDVSEIAESRGLITDVFATPQFSTSSEATTANSGPPRWFSTFDAESAFEFSYANTEALRTYSEGLKVVLVEPKLSRRSKSNVTMRIFSFPAARNFFVGIMANKSYTDWPPSSFNGFGINDSYTPYVIIDNAQIQAGTITEMRSRFVTVSVEADMSVRPPTLRFEVTTSNSTSLSPIYTLSLPEADLDNLYFAASVYYRQNLAKLVFSDWY